MAKTKSKLNMAAMKKAAKELSIRLPKGDPKAAAEAIREHMHANYEEDSLAACGNCGYEAQIDFDPCPYCGVELGEPGEEPPEKTKKPKTKKPKTKKKGKKKPVELAKPDPKMIEECEQRIDRIQSFKANIAETAYEIGLEIKEIHDKMLWKHMGFKSFNEFCLAKLDYTRVMAYKYMAMANFKKPDAVLLGPSKADMISTAPKAKKAQLLKMGREGKSRSEMQAYLNKGKNSGAGKGDGKGPDPENKITLVGRIGEDDISIPWLGDKTGKPTKSTTKYKHAELEIVTGVMLTVREGEDNDLVLSFSKIEE